MRRAVHRTVLAVDVAGFSDARRTNPHRVAVRDGLYSALAEAFRSSGIPWESCHREDRGDGVLVLAPPEVAKSLFTDALPTALIDAMHEYNTAHHAPEQIRLRVAVHAGEVYFDDHGVAGTAVNFTFRLLEAAPLKAALAASRAPLALITSTWFYEEVVRHSTSSEPGAFQRIHFTVKETTDTAWIWVPGGEAPEDPAAPHQLPAHSQEFSGRSAELQLLDSLLESTTAVAIDGTAGVGKTALALHWAHHNAGNFPDGQLYVNLLGFDPTASPLLPAEAVRGFLDALGVPPDRIPVDLHAQAALYRSHMASRRMLIVLDNATDAEHVRPLLPGGGSPSRVVITSRHRLTSLVTQEGARPIQVDIPDAREAETLLTRRMEAHRAVADPVIGELVERCARLPLALAVTAARAATAPQISLRDLADELADEHDRLDILDSGDPLTSLRAVFSCSYRRLSEPAAQLFRWLGVSPGPDTGLPAAAALIGADIPRTRRLTAELTRAHLLEEHKPGRFRFHDLLRAYAAELASADEPDQSVAVRRILDYYLHTGFSASQTIEPHRHPITLIPPADGVTPRTITSNQAKAWFTAEYANVLSAIDRAAIARLDVHAWQLPWMFTPFLYWHGHWHDLLTSLETAMTAARRLGDIAAQAVIHRLRGNAYTELGRRDESLREYEQAAKAFRATGNPEGEAYSYYSIAVVSDRHNMIAEAISYAHKALDLYRGTENRIAEARALSTIGWYEARSGNYAKGLEQCERALTLLRELGDDDGIADTLNSTGFARSKLGRYAEAVSDYSAALDLWKESGSDFHRATTLTQMGDTHHAAGDVDAARAVWGRALAILEALDHREAVNVRDRIAGL